MSDNFKKLLEQLEPLLSKQSPDMEKAPAAAFLQGSNSSSDQSAKFVQDPTNFELSTSHHNRVSLALCANPTKPLEWLVQVYADVEGVIHFQAKSSAVDPFYLRWYISTTQKGLEGLHAFVKDAQESAPTQQFRKSFYSESGKKYYICERVSETEVNIPGWGTLPVPELFGISSKTAEYTESENMPF